MKNEYMFFEENQFDMVDLLEYKKEDISIPKTSIHIYSFSCADGMDGFENEEMQAKKLDELTIMLDIHYNNKYKIIYSESSRFFCNELYPLIVEFETLLRKTLYISRALYNSGEINSESFKYLDDKKEKTIEELEFGTIYTCIFTDKNLKPEILKKYTYPMTKSDLIDIINEIPEETEWRKWVGTQYNFIENNFIKIKDIRNSIMHNHLIDYIQYEENSKLIKKANAELNTAISDKLLINDNKYLNEVNIVDVIIGIGKAIMYFSEFLKNMQETSRISFVDSGKVESTEIQVKSDLLVEEKMELEGASQ